MRWCRLYNETPADPKFRYIAAQAGVAPVVVIGVWTAMLCHASGRAGSERGTLAGWDPRIVAFDLGMDPPVLMRVQGAMEGLLLDGTRLIAWDKRQFETDSSRERTRAWRERQASRDVTDGKRDVTNRHQPSRDVPDTESEKNSDPTDQAPPPAPPELPAPPDARAVLWREGLPRLERLTGKRGQAVRGLMGKMLREARDDCALVSSVLHDAEVAQPMDPIPWVKAAIARRMGGAADPRDKAAWIFTQQGGAFDDAADSGERGRLVAFPAAPGGGRA